MATELSRCGCRIDTHACANQKAFAFIRVNLRPHCTIAVTRERIRQIEAKALRKLRHPSRSHRLWAFLDTSVHD